MPGSTVQPANGGTSYVESHSSHPSRLGVSAVQECPSGKIRTNPDDFATRPELNHVVPGTYANSISGRPEPLASIRVNSWLPRQNRTKQNDFRNFRDWTVAAEALTTTPLQIVRFSAVGILSPLGIRHSSFVTRRVL